MNVIHIRDETGSATDATIRAALDAAADVAMWTAQVTVAAVSDIAITPLDGVHATTHAPPATPAKWTGQNGTVYAPASALLIKIGTGLRGRTHRGRVFLPFVNQAAQLDGGMDPTIVATVGAAWLDFAEDLFAGSPSLSFGVASYKLAQFNEERSVSAEVPLGTQRRRQGRLR